MISHPLPRLVSVACLIFLLAILVACESEPESLPPPTLTPFPPDQYIGLSDSAASLEALITEAYEAASGRRAPIFLTGNDETLRDDLEQGRLEGAIVHQLPAESPLWFSPVGVDGVVIIAHPDLGIQELSSGQVRAIFDGSIINWSEVGGPDLPISLFSRESGAGASDIFLERLMEDVPVTGLAQVAPSEAFMRSQVAAIPGAVGYSMMSGGVKQALLLDGLTATPDTVADQSYPLTTPLYFVSQSEPEGALREFVAWLQSPDGQAALSVKFGRVR